MGRWSPTVVAEAPRNAGMGLATLGSAALSTYSTMEEMREQRRRRELQEQEARAQEQYRQRTLANEATRLDMVRKDYEDNEKYRTAQMELDIAKAGGQRVDPNVPATGNAQPGSTVSNARAGQQESDLQRIQREASEMYPATPTQWQDPRSGTTYRMDANRAARDKFIEQRMKDLTEANKGTLQHQRALEIEQERTKRALEAARIRGRSSRSSGGTGTDGTNVTDTQMRSELRNMQKDFGRLQAARNAASMNPDSDSYDETGSARRRFEADSITTVNRYRPENNPTMAAALDRYELPEGAEGFLSADPRRAVDPLPRGTVETQMQRLAQAAAFAATPEARKAAQMRLEALAQMVNQKKMR